MSLADPTVSHPRRVVPKPVCKSMYSDSIPISKYQIPEFKQRATRSFLLFRLRSHKVQLLSSREEFDHVFTPQVGSSAQEQALSSPVPFPLRFSFVSPLRIQLYSTFLMAVRSYPLQMFLRRVRGETGQEIFQIISGAYFVLYQ